MTCQATGTCISAQRVKRNDRPSEIPTQMPACAGSTISTSVLPSPLKSPARIVTLGEVVHVPQREKSNCCPSDRPTKSPLDCRDGPASTVSTSVLPSPLKSPATTRGCPPLGRRAHSLARYDQVSPRRVGP